MKIDVDFFWYEFQYFPEMWIVAVHATWTENLDQMQIGIPFFAMFDTGLEFRDFFETPVIEHVVDFDDALFDDSSTSYSEVTYFGISYMPLRHTDSFTGSGKACKGFLEEFMEKRSLRLHDSILFWGLSIDAESVQYDDGELFHYNKINN